MRSSKPGCLPGADQHLPRVWADLSAGAALLAIAGSLVGLLAAGPIYSQETSALSNAAAAQDLVNLVLVSPLLLVLAVRSWAWQLDTQPDGTTRLITRIRSRIRWTPMSIAFSGLMELGDFWMIRKMLHGLRERAEIGVAE